MPFGVEASSLFEDQGGCLAPSTITPDDEVPATAHGPGLSCGVLVMCKGSGRLLAPVLRLPPSLGGMEGGRGRPPRGDLEGGFLAVSWQRNILMRS